MPSCELALVNTSLFAQRQLMNACVGNRAGWKQSPCRSETTEERLWCSPCRTEEYCCVPDKLLCQLKLYTCKTVCYGNKINENTVLDKINYWKHVYVLKKAQRKLLLKSNEKMSPLQIGAEAAEPHFNPS